ncbi:MAG TPA: hypothetical protein VJ579_05035 [Candidatus Paceibacterota bacterium]|nr:hypothetical protein [Candidatus Paceibacterota bacterium]
MKEELHEEGNDGPLKEFAKSLVAIEDPMPEKHDLGAVLEMLGRIEHELVLYRRERLLKSYLIAALVILPLIGFGFLIPEFLRTAKF